MQVSSEAQSEYARRRLVIAGASGSIGTALCRALSDDYEIVAVTHFEARAKMPDPDLPVTWRHCDLFSRSGMAEALAGADYAIYLVHTRLPSARLDQAQCEDMDAIIADNFARAASINGVHQILCLRGLQPPGELPAEVRRQRNEVVECLGAYGTPVTVVRASLVVAPGSTAVNLVGSQVNRGRLVPIPRWALSLKQPIAIDDLIRAIRHCIGNPEAFTGSFDVGGPEILNWRQVLEQAAELQGTRPVFLPLRWMPRWAYTWWLRRRSPRTHRGTIRLLVEDLQFNSLAKGNPLQRVVDDGAIECREAIRPFLESGDRERLVNPRSRIMGVYEDQLRESSSVRSIQRIMRPAGKKAAWMVGT
jgi:nucleoside-diphosphate-sugar epimerase